MAEPKWRQRLETVVDAVFGGNAFAAAATAGIAPSNFARMLSGHVEDPRLNTLRKLADAFNVPLTWLLGDQEHLPEESQQPQDPTWLILIDRYHMREQKRILGHLKPGQEIDPGVRSALALVEQSRRTTFDVVRHIIAGERRPYGGTADHSGEMKDVRLTREAANKILRRAVGEAMQGGTGRAPVPRSRQGGRE